MFFSLIFYIVSFILSALFVKRGYKLKKTRYIFIGLIIPIAIAALRNNVGTDYLSYVKMYDTLSTMPFLQYINASSIEIGFYAIAQITHSLNGNHFLFMGIAAIATILFYYIGIRNFSGTSTWCVWLLYLFIILPVNMNQVRQGLSMSIALIAFNYAINNKKGMSIFMFTVASLFHVSAILFIPIALAMAWINSSFCVNLSQLRRYFVSTAVGISIIITGLFAIPLLGISSSSSLIKHSFSIIEQSQLLIYLALTFLLYAVDRPKNVNTMNTSIRYLAILTPLLGLFGLFIDTYERLALFTLPYLLFAVVTPLLDKNGDIKKNRLLAFSTVISLCIIPLLITYMKTTLLGQPWIFPYNTIWQDVPYIPHDKLI